jgi:hypothetical protein
MSAWSASPTARVTGCDAVGRSAVDRPASLVDDPGAACDRRPPAVVTAMTMTTRPKPMKAIGTRYGATATKASGSAPLTTQTSAMSPKRTKRMPSAEVPRSTR